MHTRSRRANKDSGKEPGEAGGREEEEEEEEEKGGEGTWLENVSSSPLVGRPNLPLRLPLPASPNPLTIGRMRRLVDLWVDSPEQPKLVSRRHASLTYNKEDGSWVLQDLNSLNGTFVNDIKVLRVVLRDGDVVAFDVRGGLVPVGGKAKARRSVCRYRFRQTLGVQNTELPSSNVASNKKNKSAPPPDGHLDGGPRPKRAKRHPESSEKTTREEEDEDEDEDEDKDKDYLKQHIIPKGIVISCLPEPSSGDTFWIARVLETKKKGHKMVKIRWFEKDPKKEHCYVPGDVQRLDVGTIISSDVTDLLIQVGPQSFELINCDDPRLYADVD